MRATFKLYFPSQYLELVDTDYEEFYAWLKDKKRPIHCCHDSNSKEYYVFKDQILYIEVTKHKV